MRGSPVVRRRVLCFASGERSAAHLLAPLLARLARDGHEVESVPLAPPPDDALDEAGRAQIVRHRAAYRGWLRARLLEPVPPLLALARDHARRFRPDLILATTDCYAGALAAEAEGVRWLGVTASLSILERGLRDDYLGDAVDALAAERRALFAGTKAELVGPHALSPHGTLLFCAEELVAGAALPPGVRVVGPALSNEPRGDEPWFPRWRVRGVRPLVLVSFGSRFAWQPELLTVIARAAAPCRGQLVIGAGSLAETTFPLTLPGDVLAVPYLPQRELLARADVLVTHGGAVSVMEATARGVPLLVLPLGEDHPAQAEAVARAGIGVCVEPGSLVEARVRTALLALVDESGGHRRRARRIAAAAHARDGVDQAHEALSL
jgi:hypothetical protein